MIRTMKIQKIFFITLSVVLLLLAQIVSGKDSNASAVTQSFQEELQVLKQQLTQQTGAEVQIKTHGKTGMVTYIGIAPANAMRQPAILSTRAEPEDAARGFLSVYGPLFGLKDQGRELMLVRTKKADRGRSSVRFQQVHSGIPVFGGESIIQLDFSNNIISAHGKILPGITINTSPVMSAQMAQEKALEVVSKKYRDKYKVDISSFQVTTPELWIYNPVLLAANEDTTHLVWRMEVSPTKLLPIRELVLVDAHIGNTALHFNQVCAALNRQVYDHHNVVGKPLPGAPSDLKRSEGQGPSGIADVDKAYDYAGDTYNFYWNYHGRDSIDNAGMQLISTTRYCPDVLLCPYPNAFWDGTQMVYGEDFASADDVVAHEMTHGVTDHESGLIYYAQSGAINEAFSDIWGEFVDLTNGRGNDDPSVRWLLGEDLPGGAIRNMSNPPAYGNPDRIWSPSFYCGTCDNAGVHTNSGIANKAAYLMTDGGTFNRIKVTGLGITKVAKIVYEVQTNLLISSADYDDLANALQQACMNLVGTDGITSSDCNQVANAISATEMHHQAPDNLVQNPGFESGPVDWTEYSSGGFDNIGSDPSLAACEDWLAGLGGYNNAIDYIYQDITIPFDASQANFQFLYGIITSEAGRTAYDKMKVEVRRPSDNTPLKTLVTLSNANWDNYWKKSKQYNLLSYRGQTIRIQFYVTNDYSYPTIFLVDDVVLKVGTGKSPAVTSFKINGTAVSTSKAVVKLNNAATNSPTHYMASEDPTFVGSAWQTYSTAPAFTLSLGSGTKTVYFKVKNAYDESPVVSDTISALAPSVTSLKINNGATSTTNPIVKLNNTTTNSPTHFMASEDPGFAGAIWQTYSTAPSLTLSGGSGTKTVYFKVRDGFEESSVIADNILLN